jgi:sterol desaturase/sphingolipid hydroxylase (fatty acid hydroxylase superfamily)
LVGTPEFYLSSNLLIVLFHNVCKRTSYWSHIAIFFVLEDFLHYWAHRALHLPW